MSQHRRKDHPGIWWFPVWRDARKNPDYFKNLYWRYLK